MWTPRVGGLAFPRRLHSQHKLKRDAPATQVTRNLRGPTVVVHRSIVAEQASPFYGRKPTAEGLSATRFSVSIETETTMLIRLPNDIQTPDMPACIHTWVLISVRGGDGLFLDPSAVRPLRNRL